MERKLTISLIATLLLMSAVAEAQRKKQKQDTLGVYREFARTGEWYQHLPVRMKVKFVHETIPASPRELSATTDMLLYYGKNDFYMLAEGLEQIANDSLVVLVNNEAKMIKLYPNDSAMQKRLQQTALLYQPESSIQELAGRYSAAMDEEGQEIKRIALQSREKVFGTSLSKETISISYHQGSFQPRVFDQSKRSLVPVDSTTYNRLANDEHYSGRLVKTQANGSDLFFIVKEVHTVCTFTEVSHDLLQPPVRQQDRIVKMQDGSFQPVRGLEDYVLSKEF